ncbi:hypothetical protein F4808DRAFT_434230 [Astrocystis sublimbata]|nr:hypothetical protein F4808DRAFT_434230 [Astrocystis sublimbata]
MDPAWECRDQTDQAELYHNHHLRVKNRHLESENLNLKRLLRESGISWQQKQPKRFRPATRSTHNTRSTKTEQSSTLPHLPIELQLRVLQYAMTSPFPIVDPLSKSRPERMLKREKPQEPKKGEKGEQQRNHIAIHFLATCRAYHFEGRKFLWGNNTFLFTSPASLKQFSELDLRFRRSIQHVTFRIIATFYDDEDRVHSIPETYHSSLRSPIQLAVQRRPREHGLARSGFRAYSWYQLVDFLEAMLPPHDAAIKPSQLRPRLFPALESLRIDFVNFLCETLQFPPPSLHELASHQMACMLNEVIVTGLPMDDCGSRVGNELSGLVKDEGLMVTHEPTLLALKDRVRPMKCRPSRCDPQCKVVRGMRALELHSDDDMFLHDPSHHTASLPPAPPDEGEPPESDFHSCRTIWKKVPVAIEGSKRKWELFDRVSGLPWAIAEPEATMFDVLSEEDDPVVCENCGECHPGALVSDELMDMIDDDL